METIENLKMKMERFLEAGDYQGFEKFVTDHFTELPEAAQSKALMYFASQTLEAESGKASVGTLRSDGVVLLEQLLAVKTEIADEIRQEGT